jgi:hypothetical protein
VTRLPDIEHPQSPIFPSVEYGALSFTGVACFTDYWLWLHAPRSLLRAASMTSNLCFSHSFIIPLFHHSCPQDARGFGHDF